MRVLHANRLFLMRAYLLYDNPRPHNMEERGYRYLPFTITRLHNMGGGYLPILKAAGRPHNYAILFTPPPLSLVLVPNPAAKNDAK
jgi:hypothetical protein